MSVRVHRSERSRHLVVRLSAGDRIPEALVASLREEHVTCGWLRAGGVLTDVELRTFDPRSGRPGEPRRITGPVHVLALESSVGLAGGEPSLSLRAVLARETDHGLETMAGEIVRARAIGLEAFVTVFDDLALERTLDPAAGFSMLDPAASAGAPGAPLATPTTAARAPAPAPTPTTSAWSSVADVSAQSDRDPPNQLTRAQVGSSMAMPIPQRYTRQEVESDAPVPEPGDVVDHFAFGRCDVIKSDGDRLHLRVYKDQRIREIALEMLRVTRLDDEGTKRHFKLERRI